MFGRKPKIGTELAAVLAAPDDDAPRRAYAAMARRKNDPRGELIDVQLRLTERIPATERAQLRAREGQLLTKHAAKWWPFRLSAWRAHRGFLTSVSLTIDELLVTGRKLFAVEPIQELVLLDASARGIDRMAKLEWLSPSALVVRGAPGDDGVEALGALEFLPRLRRLNLSSNDVTAEGIEALALLPLAQLRALVLTGNPSGDDGAAALGRWTHSGSIERLYLARTELGAGGVGRLLETGFPNLETLCLGGNPLEDAGTLRLVAASGGMPRLRRLELPNTGLGDPGAAALAKLPATVSLDVRHNHIRNFAPLVNRFRGRVRTS